ncbi:hypothetical protein, partial [Serratia marcescens]|uniref:hypothetical protein n=1 Tax=Serratia marcescens TaxID=615 RepID=UPI0023801680
MRAVVQAVRTLPRFPAIEQKQARFRHFQAFPSALTASIINVPSAAALSDSGRVSPALRCRSNVVPPTLITGATMNITHAYAAHDAKSALVPFDYQ